MNEEEQPERRGKGDKESFLRDFFENSELYSFGIITQKGYKELAQQLDDHTSEVRRRFHRWFVISLAVCTIIGFTSTTALVGFGILLDRQGHTTDEIQQQRRDSILLSCIDQNARHDHTTEALNRAIKAEEKKHHSRKIKMKIRNSGEVSIGLINALAPHRDCNAVVREATGK